MELAELCPGKSQFSGPSHLLTAFRFQGSTSSQTARGQPHLSGARGSIRVVPGRPQRHCRQVKGSYPGLRACVWNHRIMIARVDHPCQPCMKEATIMTSGTKIYRTAQLLHQLNTMSGTIRSRARQADWSTRRDSCRQCLL